MNFIPRIRVSYERRFSLEYFPHGFDKVRKTDERDERK